MSDSDMDLEIYIVCHDQNIILNTQYPNIPNLKYIFVGQNSFDKIYDKPNVIIARNYPNNIESQKYLLSFTAWYLLAKNNICTTSHVAILEYDCTLSPSLYQQTISEIKNGYQAISFMQYGSPVRQIGYLNQVTDINADIVRITGMSHLINQCPWFHTTNQCLSLSLLRTFVNWFLNIEPKIREYDFLFLSWYHERLYSMYVSHQNIKHKVIPGLVEHTFSESHTLSKSNSLQYFDWQLYMELNPDVRNIDLSPIPKHVAIYNRYVKKSHITHSTSGYNESTAKNHFIQKGQREHRLLRIPNFNWKIYSALNPDLKELPQNEISLSLHYLQSGVKESRLTTINNFDLSSYKNNNPNLQINTKEDCILHYLETQIYYQMINVEERFGILLSATVNVGDCCYVDRRNVSDRIKDYQKAVNFYLTQTKFNLTFVDNSGYDLSFLPDHPRLEKISFQGNKSGKDLGKGYGERETINYGVENSKYLSSCQYLIKITGRLIIENITQITTNFLINNIISGPYDLVANRDNNLLPGFPQGQNQVNSQIFIFDKKCLPKLNQQIINDKAGRSIEMVIYDLIKETSSHVPPFNMLRPKIIGVSGTVSKPY